MEALRSPPSCWLPAVDASPFGSRLALLSFPACRSNFFLNRMQFLAASSSTNGSARHSFVRCCSGSPDFNSSSSSSSSSSADGWDNDDCNYLEAQVLDAVSLLPSGGHLYMAFSNGGEVEVNHVFPPERPLMFRSRNPSIFLKILSQPDLILPIIVRSSAIDMLMSALHGEEKLLRPNQYHIMKELVGNFDYEVRMVRVTERISDTYIARIYVGKPGQKEMRSVDSRPSDAVNLAVRCNVPIFVHKDLVASDAVKPVVMSSQTHDRSMSGNSDLNLDIPTGEEDPVAEEIDLVKNMHLAIVEERYLDAAQWRDELNAFRLQRS